MNICDNPDCHDPDCSGLGGGHCEHLDATEPRERYREDDPETSKAGAQRSFRKGSQKALLIMAYALYDHDNPGREMAPEQAAQTCGLFRPGICYWKRVGELRDAGMLELARDRTGQIMTWKSSQDGEQQMYRITPAGQLLALSLTG